MNRVEWLVIGFILLLVAPAVAGQTPCEFSTAATSEVDGAIDIHVEGRLARARPVAGQVIGFADVVEARLVNFPVEIVASSGLIILKSNLAVEDWGPLRLPSNVIAHATSTGGDVRFASEGLVVDANDLTFASLGLWSWERSGGEAWFSNANRYHGTQIGGQTQGHQASIDQANVSATDGRFLSVLHGVSLQDAFGSRLSVPPLQVELNESRSMMFPGAVERRVYDVVAVVFQAAAASVEAPVTMHLRDAVGESTGTLSWMEVGDWSSECPRFAEDKHTVRYDGHSEWRVRSQEQQLVWSVEGDAAAFVFNNAVGVAASSMVLITVGAVLAKWGGLGWATLVGTVRRLPAGELVRSGARYDIISHLASSHGLTGSHLRSVVGIGRSSMDYHLRLLELAGLVCKQGESVQGRAGRFQVTTKGRLVAEDLGLVDGDPVVVESGPRAHILRLLTGSRGATLQELLAHLSQGQERASRSTVRHHLDQLMRIGLVTRSRAGRCHVYRSTSLLTRSGIEESP